jgi:DNA replicative helicase MCM subunit Mcm2 (Cdc46/Mcm family)
MCCNTGCDHDIGNLKRKRINALLIGDPGLAKSGLLKAAVKLVPNSRYESSQN